MISDVRPKRAVVKKRNVGKGIRPNDDDDDETMIGNYKNIINYHVVTPHDSCSVLKPSKLGNPIEIINK